MKKLSFIGWCLLAPFAVAQCLNHEGLQHCAKGTSRLSESAGILTVDGSGVDILFAPVVSWNAELHHKNSQQLQIDATDKGQVFSSLNLLQTDEATELRSNFTGQSGGSPATLLIYQGGNLQHFITDVTVAITDPNWDTDYDFRNHSVTGACIWTLTYARLVKISVNGQTYLADQVAFVEQMGKGHYPYASFDGISITTSASFQIGFESVGCAP